MLTVLWFGICTLAIWLHCKLEKIERKLDAALSADSHYLRGSS